MWVRFPPPVYKTGKNLFLACFCFCTALTQADTTSTNPWHGFDPEQWGMTQSAYTRLRESSLEPRKALELLSMGIQPDIYLERPWKKLGLSEQAWLTGRNAGMEDLELDQSQKWSVPKHTWKSALFPGWGLWLQGKPKSALLLSGLSLGLGTLWMQREYENSSKTHWYAYSWALVHITAFTISFGADTRLPQGSRLVSQKDYELELTP